MIITDLRVNHVTEPKGYCYEPVSFSWKVEEGKEAKIQNYARITVKKGAEVVFDSGDDREADSLDYPVRFQMEPRCRYDWTVRVMADSGETAEASSFLRQENYRKHGEHSGSRRAGKLHRQMPWLAIFWKKNFRCWRK